MTTKSRHRVCGKYMCATAILMALVSRVLCDEDLPISTADGLFASSYNQRFKVDSGNSTAKLLEIAQTAYTYTPGDNNFIYDLLENAHIFYKVAFANESLTDEDDPVSLSKRAAITRRLISVQPSSIYNGLLAEFRRSMGMRCGAFPRGCYATPTTLNKASEELNGFLDRLYSQLVEAFNHAASKLEQNEYWDGRLSVCAPENISRIWCEVESLQLMMGHECGIANTSDCSPPRENLSCIWRAIDVDDFDNIAFTIRTRLMHLLMANAFCGHWSDGRRKEMPPILLSIAKGFLSAEQNKSFGVLSASQEINGWLGTIPNIVQFAVLRARMPEGYPPSNALVSNYTGLAKQVLQDLDNEWNEYSAKHNLSQPLDEDWADVLCEPFGSFVFYPCQESDYALPAKATRLKGASGKKDTSVLFDNQPSANILIWKRRDACNDSEKDDWIKENKAQLVDTLGEWKTAVMSTLQSKITAFKSGSRAWQDCFQGAAILKCAYRFVWYELGWTYFHATSDCGDFCVNVGGEGYRPCLQIVFLT